MCYGQVNNNLININVMHTSFSDILAVELDFFFILCTLMNAHIIPYISKNITQVETCTHHKTWIMV